MGPSQGSGAVSESLSNPGVDIPFRVVREIHVVVSNETVRVC